MNLFKVVCAILGILIFGKSALASDETTESKNTRYMAAAYKQYQSFSNSRDLIAYLEKHVADKDKSAFREYFGQQIPPKLPKVEIQGTEISLWQENKLTRIKLLDNEKLLFSINGKNYQVYRDQMLVDNIKNLEKLLSRENSKSLFQNIFLPKAEAFLVYLGVSLFVGCSISTFSDLKTIDELKTDREALEKMNTSCQEELKKKPELKLSENSISPDIYMVKQVSKIKTEFCDSSWMMPIDRLSATQPFTESRAAVCTLALDLMKCTQELDKITSKDLFNRFSKNYENNFRKNFQKLIFRETGPLEPTKNTGSASPAI